jgi:hypothetical protein
MLYAPIGLDSVVDPKARSMDLKPRGEHHEALLFGGPRLVFHVHQRL